MPCYSMTFGEHNLLNLGNRIGHSWGPLWHPKDESVQIVFDVFQLAYAICVTYTGLILGLCPANGRRRYKVKPSLIGWVET